MVPVPRQLPSTLPHFAVREQELATLDGLLLQGSNSRSAAIAVIAGTAGVGKTALAVQWAHRVRNRFPDGQLYVNLRGFGPSSPTPVTRALKGFLEALGVPPDRVPTNPDDQAGMYRSLLADRRMLVVLDDAHNANQVRPLLPGTPGCAVLVTSRTRLTGLAASDGASEVTLHVLCESDARLLLTRRLGAARLAAEPDAVRELIAASAGLPLALAIIAAFAAGHPESSLGELAARYTDTRHRLDKLSTGEMTTDLRTLFSWSYRSVSPAAARMFRLLGVHPGPDISLAAATSLAGLEPERAGRLLVELTTAHLVTEHRCGRFALHDLLRIYAAELARADVATEEARLANRRALDHYLRSAAAADRMLSPAREQLALPEPEERVRAEQFETESQATAWFSIELEVLLGAVTWAADAGFDVHAWQLPFALVTHLDRREHLAEHVATQRTAIAAARRLGNVRAEAAARRDISCAYGHMREYGRARRSLARALRLFEALDDLDGQASAHLGLGWLLPLEHKYEESLEHNETALDLFTACGQPIWQARALGAVGWSLTLLGRHEQALAICEKVLHLHRDLDDLAGEAYNWDTLGEAHRRLGQRDRAVECFRRAIEMLTRLDEPCNVALVLTHLGDTYQETGQMSAARSAWHQALARYAELNRPEADDLRARLATECNNPEP
jgi:tetratricopeptide (TPR) repeat protein